jgi:tetratricopeptide (TPR) repeat protein
MNYKVSSDINDNTLNYIEKLRDMILKSYQDLQKDSISPNELRQMINKEMNQLLTGSNWKRIIGEISYERILNLYNNLTTSITEYDNARNIGNMDTVKLTTIKTITFSISEGLGSIIESMKEKNPISERYITYNKENENQQIIPTRSTIHFLGEKRLFVGREDYIDKKIKDLLKEPGSRVSVIGPGGSGKSQLAFKALHEYYENDKFIDLVIPVYFSATLSYTVIGNDASTNGINSISFRKFLNDIGFYLIRTLTLPIKEQEFDQFSINTCQHTICEALGKIKHPILYCDNFETLSSLIEENKRDQNAKSIIDFLNNQLPINVSLLITSRNRRNFLLEEYPIILEGLKIEEGISLFIKNASAYQDHLCDTKNTKIQNLLKKIITKTGGHPLSIEILAKTYQGGGETELDEIFYTLGKEREDPFASEERLQSLQNCFDYSIDKLESNIQKLLPLLTIFHSPFLADVVEKIFVKETKDNLLLLELYNKNLLSRIERDKDGSFASNKFWLYTIHPALSNYLKDKYKSYISKNESELIPHFCNYYCCILNETYYAWGKECHHDFMRRYAIISKVDDNDFNRSIEFAENNGDENLKQIGATISMYLGLINGNLGLYDEALEYHKKALAIHQKTNDKVGMAQDYTYIGVAYRYKGLYDEALEYHKKALAMHEELNDRVGMAVNYGRIGLVYSSKGFYDKSLEYLLQSLKIREELKDNVGLAQSYGGIGTVYRYKGLYDEALEYHKKALAMHEELKDRSGIALNYTTIGGTYRDKGLYEEAIEYHKKALAIDEELNDRVGMAVNYTNIGLAYEDKGLYEEAIGYLRKSLVIDEELNDRVGIAVNYSRLGEVYQCKGLYDEAIEYHKKALAIDEEIKNNWNIATNYSHIGVAYRYKGLYDEALEYHKKALAMHEDTNDKVGTALNYSRLGEVYQCKGLYDEAIEYHKKALAIYDMLKDKVNLPKTFYSLGLLYKRKNLELESKEAMDNVKKMILDFKKDTGYNHTFERNIDSIVEINM